MIAALVTLAWVAIVAVCGLWLHVREVRRTLNGAGRL
jgi:hypothetical protein